MSRSGIVSGIRSIRWSVRLLVMAFVGLIAFGAILLANAAPMAIAQPPDPGTGTGLLDAPAAPGASTPGSSPAVTDPAVPSATAPGVPAQAPGAPAPAPAPSPAPGAPPPAPPKKVIADPQKVAGKEELNTVTGRVANLANLKDPLKACQYLTFCRWNSVADVPSADVGLTNMGQTLQVMGSNISSVLLKVASTMFFLIGVALTFMMSIDFISNAVYLVDYLFAKVTLSILGMTGNATTALGTMVVISAIFVAFKIVNPKNKGFHELGLRSLGISMIAIVGFGVMAYQATKNHPVDPVKTPNGVVMAPASGETSPVAGKVDYTNGSKVGQVDKGTYKTPSDWATFSPGWVVAMAASGAGMVGGVVGEATSNISAAITSNAGSDSFNACDRYIGGLHAAYYDTGAVKGNLIPASTMVQYDNLVTELYFKNFQWATLGNSVGAQNAWCRVAENQAKIPPADQFMVGRVSGLYKEIIGSGGLGVVDDNPSYVVDPADPAHGHKQVAVSGGTYLNDVGSWTAPKDARPEDQSTTSQAGLVGQSSANAMNVTGYNFRSQDASRQFTAYYAACIWPEAGGDVQVNPEWANVRQAPIEKTTDPLASGDDTIGEHRDNCVSDQIITNQNGKGFGAASDGGKNDVTLAFQYQDPKGSAGDKVWSAVSSFIGIGGGNDGHESIMKKFDSASLSDGSNPALDYYVNSTGANGVGGMLFSLISVVMMWMTARYILPLLIGGLFAQFIAIAALTLVAFLALLLIFPSQKTRQSVKSVFQVIFASLLSGAILTSLFAFTFALVQLFRFLFSSVTPDLLLVRALISALSAWGAFWVINKALQKGLGGFDMKSMSSGIKVGAGAVAPMFQRIGFDDFAAPFEARFWNRGRKDDEDKDHVVGDATHGHLARIGDDDPLSDKHALSDKQHDKHALEAKHGRKNELGLASRGSDKAALAEGGLDVPMDALAAGASTLAFGDHLKNKLHHHGNHSLEHGVEGMFSPMKELGVGHSHLDHANNHMTPQQTAELLNSSSPRPADMSADGLAGTGITVPTPENINELAANLPGLTSSNGGPMDPQTIQNIFDDQNMMAMGGSNFSSGNPIMDAGSVAWIAGADGVLSAAQVAQADSIAQGYQVQSDNLRAWAENLGANGMGFLDLDSSQFSVNDSYESPIPDTDMPRMDTGNSGFMDALRDVVETKRQAFADVLASAQSNPAPSMIDNNTWDSFQEMRESLFQDVADMANENASVAKENLGVAQGNNRNLEAMMDSLNREKVEMMDNVIGTISEEVSYSENNDAPVRATFNDVVSRIIRRG